MDVCGHCHGPPSGGSSPPPCRDRPLLPGTYHCGGVGVGKKESAEIYERAMRRLQSNKKDTVVFEDAFHAIQTAKAAGFRVAAVYDASEEAHQEEIRGLADYYIRSFEEMFETRELE